MLLEISQNSQENTGARPAILLKKGLWHRCFRVSFAKFLGTPFLTEDLRWMLLTYFVFTAFYFLETLEKTKTLWIIYSTSINVNFLLFSSIFKCCQIVIKIQIIDFSKEQKQTMANINEKRVLETLCKPVNVSNACNVPG